MEQYINKDDIIAEINKRIKEISKEFQESEYVQYTLLGKIYALENLLPFLDTLEVKEVDFEKELDEWMKIGPHTSYPWCTIPDAIKITAVKFFELGLNSQTKDVQKALHTEYEKADTIKELKS